MKVVHLNPKQEVKASKTEHRAAMIAEMYEMDRRRWERRKARKQSKSK